MPRNKLMDNYGWVQNTSNLSTIRDTVDLVPDTGIGHLDLKACIRDFRRANNDLPTRWDWDARCRIKAIHAVGLVKLNRYIQGYDLSDLGRQLKNAPKSSIFSRNIRLLTDEEKVVLRQGLLTSAPVVRVLELLNDDRRAGNNGLSKYDIGGRLGFVGDIGFTHLDPFWVVSNGYSFNNKEGDADKWARTILSWLEQVGWVFSNSSQNINGKRLKAYKVIPEIENILRYDSFRIGKNVPAEMLCSDHHSFPKLIQKRRSTILSALAAAPITIDEIVSLLERENISCSSVDARFEIINLRNAGFRIEENGGYYKLKDQIELDLPLITLGREDRLNALEQTIEDLVVRYEMTIPPRFIDHLVRFGSDSTDNSARKFESIIAEYFRFLGYDTRLLGHGRGRVADIVVKYVHPGIYASSYGVIIDVKASSSAYNFPASDKRKMKEYINKHGQELMREDVPNHAFSFISSNFINNVAIHLREIANDTRINGCAIDINTLLDLGDKIRRQVLSIENIFPKYELNDRFIV